MFVRGKEYKRTDLHDGYGGQRQSGISTPAAHPFIFVFTGDTGKRHGYDDYWEDGVFNYFGEGRVGDMRMTKGNRAIRDHVADGKTLQLFQRTRQGFVSYLGEAYCIGNHRKVSQDGRGKLRNSIVFELELDPDAAADRQVPDLRTSGGPKQSGLWTMSLDGLMKLASTPTLGGDMKTRTQRVRKRSEAVKIAVRRRANGVCEGCESPAPFNDRHGRPFLEAHHIFQRADDGPDNPSAVIALCPNCHRRVHSGGDGYEFNKALTKQLAEAHPPGGN
jgi:5-methylcytosine-specific restriction protein A